MARIAVLPRLACKTSSTRSLTRNLSCYKAVGAAAKSLRSGTQTVKSVKRNLWQTVALFGGAAAASAGVVSVVPDSPNQLRANEFVGGGASGVGGGVGINEPTRLGIGMIPHPEKAAKGGEDAYFMAQGPGNGNVAFGVFDGVGGWAQLGVDSGEYSRALAAGCKTTYQSGQSNPVKILQDAYGALHHITGSCTACVLVLEGNTLTTANLGDSGFMIIRDGVMFYRTKEQQHQFNFPFQLGTDSLDTPLDADTHVTIVLPNDFIVVATDGVFDNLFDEEIVVLVAEMRSNGASPSTISTALVEAAFAKGRQTSGVETPFRSGVLELGYQFEGGKLDDNTCLCVEIGSVQVSSRL